MIPDLSSVCVCVFLFGKMSNSDGNLTSREVIIDVRSM